MSRHAVSRRLAALAAAAALGAALPAAAGELPTDVRGGDAVTAEIEPAGDVDAFAIPLLAGDVLSVKIKHAGSTKGLLSTLSLAKPDGAPAAATVKGAGKTVGSLTYTALTEGVHVVTVTPSEGTSFGALGGYTISFATRHAPQPKGKFADPPGGQIVHRFGATNGATITVAAGTRKGGFDLTSLVGPGGVAEAGFPAAVKAAASRRSAKVAKYVLTGATGTYELRGAYDAGSAVLLTVKVKHAEKARRRTFGPEPRFDRLWKPFPSEAVVGWPIFVVPDAGTFSHVDAPARPWRAGDPNLACPDTPYDCSRPPPATYDDPADDTYPRFFVGTVEVPRATILRDSGGYRFPAPEGLVVGPAYDITVENLDGQRVSYDDAFSIVPPPIAASLATLAGDAAVEAGPGGGRRLRITGSKIRSGTIVLVDVDAALPIVVNPSVRLTNRIDFVAPPHLPPNYAPGAVRLRIRDEFGQTADVPGTLTYLDVPFNQVTSVDAAFLQALGGETVTVAGTDFGADSVFTLDGADVDAAVLGPTQARFTAPAHADGTAVLRVTGAYEQTSSIQVAYRGFTDRTQADVPAPRTATNEADGWRGTRMLAGDVTGDGLKDLVLLQSAKALNATSNRSRVRILVAGSSGAFSDTTASAMPAVSGDEDWRAEDAALVDLDGDGDLDLALVTPDPVSGGARPSLRLLRNDGTGTFTDRTTTWAPAIETYSESDERRDPQDAGQGYAIVAADVDHTGGIDLVVAHAKFFTDVVVTVLDPGNPPETPPTLDIDTTHYPATRVFLNDGSGKLTRSAIAMPAVDPSDPQQLQGEVLAAADVDGNGWTDVVLTRPVVTTDGAGTYYLTARLLKNTGGVFTDASATSLPAASDPEFLHADRAQFGDAEGDGDLDLFLVRSTALASPSTGVVSPNPALRLFLNSGGQFSAAAPGTFPAKDGADVSQGDDFALGDLDGDGDLDVVVVANAAPNSASNAARILRRQGTGWVPASLALPNPLLADDGRGTGVVLLDLKADGDLDVAIVRNDPDETVRNTRLLVNPRK